MGLKCIKLANRFADNKKHKTGKVSCYLREAEWEDMDLLFRWANDGEVRKNSFSVKEIAYEEHVEWFKKKIGGGESQIYIFGNGEHEIGTLRLDFEGNEAVISYSIAAEYRKKGYGTVMIKLAEQKVPHRTLMKAWVKEENIASNKIFIKLGYKRDGMQYKKWIE